MRFLPTAALFALEVGIIQTAPILESRTDIAPLSSSETASHAKRGPPPPGFVDPSSLPRCAQFCFHATRYRHWEIQDISNHYFCKEMLTALTEPWITQYLYPCVWDQCRHTPDGLRGSREVIRKFLLQTCGLDRWSFEEEWGYPESKSPAKNPQKNDTKCHGSPICGDSAERPVPLDTRAVLEGAVLEEEASLNTTSNTEVATVAPSSRTPILDFSPLSDCVVSCLYNTSKVDLDILSAPDFCKMWEEDRHWRVYEFYPCTIPSCGGHPENGNIAGREMVNWIYYTCQQSQPDEEPKFQPGSLDLTETSRAEKVPETLSLDPAFQSEGIGTTELEASTLSPEPGYVWILKLPDCARLCLAEYSENRIIYNNMVSVEDFCTSREWYLKVWSRSGAVECAIWACKHNGEGGELDLAILYQWYNDTCQGLRYPAGEEQPSQQLDAVEKASSVQAAEPVEEAGTTDVLVHDDVHETARVLLDFTALPQCAIDCFYKSANFRLRGISVNLFCRNLYRKQTDFAYYHLFQHHMASTATDCGRHNQLGAALHIMADRWIQDTCRGKKSLSDKKKIPTTGAF